MTSASSTCDRRPRRVMNASTVADALLIGAAVVWVLARQVQLARVKPRLLLLAPLVLAFFGIRSLPTSTWRVPADLALLAVSAALSLGLGAWRGQTIRVWRDADGTWWRQGSVLTLVLWGVLIVVRGLLYGVGVAVGHREASGLGAVLVTLALSFAAQNAVTGLRMSRPPAAARSPRHSWLLTIASMAAGTNASKPAGRSAENAGKRGAGTDARADTGRVALCPRAGGAAPGQNAFLRRHAPGGDAPLPVRGNDLPW
jgi:hypothetical protein